MTLSTYSKRRPVNLVSIIAPEFQLPPNRNQEEHGLKYIKIYLHPLSEHLGFSAEGIPYSNIRSHSKWPQPRVVEWERHAINCKWGKGRKQLRYKIHLRAALGKELGVNTNQSVARIALECFLYRPLEQWEQACHINGIAQDNSKSNLRASDIINNSIDEIEVKRQRTNLENLLLARERINTLINDYETTN